MPCYEGNSFQGTKNQQNKFYQVPNQLSRKWFSWGESSGNGNFGREKKDIYVEYP